MQIRYRIVLFDDVSNLDFAKPNFLDRIEDRIRAEGFKMPVNNSRSFNTPNELIEIVIRDVKITRTQAIVGYTKDKFDILRVHNFTAVKLKGDGELFPLRIFDSPIVVREEFDLFAARIVKKNPEEKQLDKTMQRSARDYHTLFQSTGSTTSSSSSSSQSYSSSQSSGYRLGE